jgi:hypothetical protein
MLSGPVPQCFDEPDGRLQAKIQFGEQHPLQFLAEVRQPPLRRHPQGRGSCLPSVGKRLLRRLEQLLETSAEQQRHRREQLALTNTQNLLQSFIQGGKLLERC